MTTPREPVTAAGRRFVYSYEYPVQQDEAREVVLAIEAEAYDRGRRDGHAEYEPSALELLADPAPPARPDPLSPQWEACKVCGGDHWTKDHAAPPARPTLDAHRWDMCSDSGTDGCPHRLTDDGAALGLPPAREDMTLGGGDQ